MCKFNFLPHVDIVFFCFFVTSSVVALSFCDLNNSDFLVCFSSSLQTHMSTYVFQKTVTPTANFVQTGEKIRHFMSIHHFFEKQ